jgi:peptidoglycan/xylan/chitin deacetylase (PgdA/CDA1 family)
LKAPAALTGTLAASAGVFAYAVRGRSSTLLAPSVYRGARDRPAIALTFDDGPSEATPALLDILAAYNVRATFFQCGANVRRLPHIARAVAAAGHEIGNHSDTHPYLSFRSRAFIARELSRAQESIQVATGVRPVLFRAPFGVRWFGLREVQHWLGLLGVMWTTIGVDWKWREERVSARLLGAAQSGAIFCLHDGRQLEARPDAGGTLRSVEKILPILIDKGYHFERVSEIICPTI